MKRIIYADNAATTRIDPAVLEAMEPFTKEEYANASQPYSFSRKAKAAIQNAREEIANCINASWLRCYTQQYSSWDRRRSARCRR